MRQHWRQENQPEAASPASPGCGRNKKEAMPTKQMGRNDFRKLSSDLHKCPMAPVNPLTQLKTKRTFSLASAPPIRPSPVPLCPGTKRHRLVAKSPGNSTLSCKVQSTRGMFKCIKHKAVDIPQLLGVCEGKVWDTQPGITGWFSEQDPKIEFTDQSPREGLAGTWRFHSGL